MPFTDVSLTANFTDQIPKIAVSPDQFQETIQVGKTSSKKMSISNEALGYLNWSLYTEYVVGNKS